MRHERFNKPRILAGIALLCMLPGAGCSGGGGKGSSLLAALGIGGWDAPEYSQEVGPEGGTVTDPRGGQVIIPAGALSEKTTITIRTYKDQDETNRRFGITPFNGCVDFGPDGNAFALPVTVRIPAGEKMTPGETRALFIYDDDSGTWEESGFTATVDSSGYFLTASVAHFCPMGIGVYQMDFCKVFRYLFHGDNVYDALYRFATYYVNATGLFAGLSVTAAGSTWVVQGIRFDAMYTINGADGQAFVEVGDFGSSSANRYRSESQSYDYMDGGNQIIYHLLVTVCWMRVGEVENGLSVAIYQPFHGKELVDSTEWVAAAVSQGKDTSPITKVEFYIEGVGRIDDTTPPYSYNWSTAALGNGRYTLKATAYNAAGITAVSKKVIVKKGTADVVPPEPFVKSTISFEGINSTTIRLKWRKGSDDVSAQSHLQYKVVRSDLASRISEGGLYDFLNGDTVQDWTTDIDTAVASGLDPNVVYYFNVAVRDEADNAGFYTVSCPDRVTGVNFLDSDTDVGQVKGTLTFNPMPDEDSLSGYSVYWGSDGATKASGRIALIPKSGAPTYRHEFPENTVKPNTACYILVYYVMEGGREGDFPGSVDFQDQGMMGKLIPAYPLNLSASPFTQGGAKIWFRGLDRDYSLDKSTLTIMKDGLVWLKSNNCNYRMVSTLGMMYNCISDYNDILEKQSGPYGSIVGTYQYEAIINYVSESYYYEFRDDHTYTRIYNGTTTNGTWSYNNDTFKMDGSSFLLDWFYVDEKLMLWIW